MQLSSHHHDHTGSVSLCAGVKSLFTTQCYVQCCILMQLSCKHPTGCNYQYCITSYIFFFVTPQQKLNKFQFFYSAVLLLSTHVKAEPVLNMQIVELVERLTHWPQKCGLPRPVVFGQFSDHGDRFNYTKINGNLIMLIRDQASAKKNVTCVK